MFAYLRTRVKGSRCWRFSGHGSVNLDLGSIPSTTLWQNESRYEGYCPARTPGVPAVLPIH